MYLARDMLRLSPDLTAHELNVNLGARPVKLKKRAYSAAKDIVVEEKVNNPWK